ncbi:MAG: hypothetical protein IT562_13025 [Alphaproteobacteria bacterium]|nr:hypothetical protein [Alphaproteobacteria bacterium]
MRKFSETMRRGLSQSFFVRRGGQYEYIKAGDVFRQRNGRAASETAVVVSIGLDGQQIPHVRYRLSFRRGRGVEFDGGSRIMALKPFLKLYSDRVAVAPTVTAAAMSGPAEAAD